MTTATASPPASRGGWMTTYTGRRFWPLDPDPQDIDLRDIAHALGNLCRFNGHVERFYSVAEHCWLLSFAVAPEHALHAVLHDATEAYVGDMIRPLKRNMPDFREAEDRVWQAIAARFHIDPEMPAEVQDADYRILLNERTAFLPNNRHPWEVDSLLPLTFPDGLAPAGFPPAVASVRYAHRLIYLMETRGTR